MFCGSSISNTSRLIPLSLHFHRFTPNYNDIHKRKNTTLTNYFSQKEKTYGHRGLEFKVITSVFGGWNAMLFSLFNINKPEEKKVWNVHEMVNQSVLFRKKGEFLKAELILRIALIQALFYQDNDGIISVYCAMANLAYDSGNYEKAEKTFQKLLEKLFSIEKSENDLKVIYTRWMLAKICEQKGEIQDATEGYNLCKKLFELHLEKQTVDDSSLSERILLMSWYAKMLMSEFRIAEAIKYSQEAYNLSLKVNGKEDERTMNSLSSLITVGSKGGKYDQAIAYLSAMAELG